MTNIDTEILIVGGGAAGLSAAASAAEKANVVIVDDNPTLGGQIWRAELGKIRSPKANELIRGISSGKVMIINNAQVFADHGLNCLLAETPEGRIDLKFQKLVIATGARERFLPFPGWTLPGVFGAGGLQALVKGGMKIAGKRVLVSGTGPLLFAVADYLKKKGAIVKAIAEQTAAVNIRLFGLRLLTRPAKLLQALSMRSRLLNIPYLPGCWVTKAHGEDRISGVTLTSGGRSWDVECDYLACGFHLVPNTELAAMLGCSIVNGQVAVDMLQQTSIPDIYCAGEPTAVAGLESSLVEGTIAGLAAVGNEAAARALIAKRDEARQFGEAITEAFALRPELRELPQPDTIVCRCEDVAYGRLLEFTDSREAKLQTRCGMGSCQGRVCGAANEFLFGWKTGKVRPPIFPVKMEEL